MNTICHFDRADEARRAGKNANAPKSDAVRVRIGKRAQKGDEAMTAMLMERKCQISQREQRSQNREQTREEAVERLVHLLEVNTLEYAHLHSESALELESDVELSSMARLSAAHAAYALADGSKMRRISPGAWLHERHAQPE